MKIVADQNIPALSDLLSGAGSLSRFSERTPPEHLLADADALLVRSITEVDAALLAKAPCLQFVASATIGTEHIDQQALKARGIAFAHAPGANAQSVGEYVLCAVLDWLNQRRLPLLDELDVAIVGAGHTGTAAGKRLQALGLNVHYYDPPLASQGEARVHTHWQRVLSADIISCHVPLTMNTETPTHHLFESTALQSLHAEQLLINASRGAVIHHQALLERMQQGQAPSLVLDVWEHEPEVLEALVPFVRIATPHIAGHSLEGKVGGAVMIANALLDHFGYQRTQTLSSVLPTVNVSPIEADRLSSISDLAEWAEQHYDLSQDDQRFRESGRTASGFDALRRQYRKETPRREFINQVVTCHNSEQYIRFKQLGFNARQRSG